MAILKFFKREQEASSKARIRTTSNDALVNMHAPTQQHQQYDYWSFGTTTPSPNNSIRFESNNNNNNESPSSRDSSSSTTAYQWSHHHSDDDDERNNAEIVDISQSPPTEKSALLPGNDSTTSLMTLSMGSSSNDSSDHTSFLNLDEEETGKKTKQPSPWTLLASNVRSGDFASSYNSSSRMMTTADYAKSERQKKRKDAQESIRNSMELSLTTCVIAMLLYMGVAVVAFHFVLPTSSHHRWTVIDSCYFALVTATTIGYGDMVPQGFAARIFTCFFAVSGIAFLGIALGVLGSRFIEAQERAVQQASELSRRRAMSLFSSSSSSSSPTNENTSTLPQNEENVEEQSPQGGMKHILLELAAVGVLLVIFAFVLKNDPGIDVNQADSWWKQWGNAMYFVLITATTVGYGDFSPQSQTGRLLAIFFITLSVGAMGHWLSLVATYIMENRQSELRKQMQAKELTMEDLEVMDEDGDGQVTQIEFLEFMLVAMNKVDSETVKGLKEYFHRLDRDGNGTLSKEDLVDTVKGKLPTSSSARHKLELSSYKNELLSKGRMQV